MLLILIEIMIIVIGEIGILFWAKKRKKQQKKVSGLQRESDLYRKLSDKYEEHGRAVNDEYYSDYKEIVMSEEILKIEHAKCVIKREKENTAIFSIIIAGLQVVLLGVAKLTAYSIAFSFASESIGEKAPYFDTKLDIIYHFIEIITLIYFVMAILMPAMHHASKQGYFLEIIQNVLDDMKSSIKKEDIAGDCRKRQDDSSEIGNRNEGAQWIDETINFQIQSTSSIEEIYVKIRR